jgi:PAS domain S-box-containing protein
MTISSTNESTLLLNRLTLTGDHFKDCSTIVDMADSARRCIYVNSAFTLETGFSADETIGRNLAFLQGEQSSSVAVEFMRHCFENSLAFCQDIVNYRKNGSAFVNRLVMLPMRRDEAHYLGFHNDVTDQYDNSSRDINLSRVTHAEISHVLNNALANILIQLDLALVSGNASHEAMVQGVKLIERINRFCRYSDNGQDYTGYNPFRAT